MTVVRRLVLTPFICLLLCLGATVLPVSAGGGLSPALGATTVASVRSDPTPVGQWPLQPRPAVVAGFDPPAQPWQPGHRGVDLLGEPGQPVHAALPGRISYAGLLAGRGVVVVDHGDTRTTYEPVAPSVSVGAEVPVGAVLGTLSPAGSHCPPQACLHWGWLRGEQYLNPLLLVGGGPVRLLPLWVSLPVTSSYPALLAPLGAWPWWPVSGKVRSSPATVRPGDAPADTPSADGRW